MTLPPGLFDRPDKDPDSPESRARAQQLRHREDLEDTLARAVHALADLTVRTTVPDAALEEVTTAVGLLTEQLEVDATEGSLGLQVRSDGRPHDPGNPMVGRRNPMAPPLVVERDREGLLARSVICLGALYEGPPTCVHGGISAAVLDQICGAAAALTGKPGMTAYLNLTYRRPTFLFQEHTVEARVVEQGEWKTLVRGEIRDAKGAVTVEAEGLFVVPRIARDFLSGRAANAS